MEIRAINPEEWRPSAWKFLHYVALVYPSNPTDEDKNNYKNFFYSLQHVLPCSKCSENYKKHLKDYPIDNSLRDNDSLFKWTVDIHNEVNIITNKDTFSYEQAYDLYLNKQQNIQDNFMLFGFILLVLIFGFYIKKYV